VSPVAEPASKKPSFVAQEIPVVTGETVPGQQIDSVVGVVVGVTTRSRDVKVGPETISLLAQARQDAIAALVTMAVEAGAHAVVGLRFDGGKIADALSEVTAYGTAVTLVGAPAVEQPAEPGEGASTSSGPVDESLHPTVAGDDQHIASPVPMDDPDPEDAFGAAAPRPENPIHDQQLREQHPQF